MNLHEASGRVEARRRTVEQATKGLQVGESEPELRRLTDDAEIRRSGDPWLEVLSHQEGKDYRNRDCQQTASARLHRTSLLGDGILPTLPRV